MSDKTSTHIGAGILPFAVHNGDVYYLLGKESDGTIKSRNNLFCDFGGGRKTEEKPRETAFREFLEESLNVLGMEEEIKKAMCTSAPVYNKDNYALYLVEVPFSQEIVNSYNWTMQRLVHHMIQIDYRGHRSAVLSAFPSKLRFELVQEWIKEEKSNMDDEAFHRMINELVKHHESVDQRNSPEGIAEKVELAWFTEREILVDHKDKMRPIFLETFIRDVLKQ